MSDVLTEASHIWDVDIVRRQLDNLNFLMALYICYLHNWKDTLFNPHKKKKLLHLEYYMCACMFVVHIQDHSWNLSFAYVCVFVHVYVLCAFLS